MKSCAVLILTMVIGFSNVRGQGMSNRPFLSLESENDLFSLPKEGIGFSHYHSIGLSNRPNFVKASFELRKDETISVKVIYL